MPEIIQISDSGMTLGRKPIRSLRTSIKMTDVTRAEIARAIRSHRGAKMKEAIGGIRLALIALANGRFEAAGNIAVNAAIEASVTFRKNPEMATRIIVTARGVIKNAIRGIAARSV